MLQPPKPKSPPPKGAVAAAAFPPGRDRDVAMHLNGAGHGGKLLGHVSWPTVVARQGHVAVFPLALLQCGMGYDKNKTCSFISPIPQPFLWHTALRLALGLDCS